jgi:hypothetical protein
MILLLPAAARWQRNGTFDLVLEVVTFGRQK